MWAISISFFAPVPVRVPRTIVPCPPAPAIRSVRAPTSRRRRST
jgi:hypothetical protein